MKKKLLNALLIIFSLIGLWSLVHQIIDLNNEENEAKQFIKNCNDIQIGMTLKEVRETMGDSTWNSKVNSPQLYYSYYGNEPVYELDYATLFGASGWPIIQFDTATMKVKSVNCRID